MLRATALLLPALILAGSCNAEEADAREGQAADLDAPIAPGELEGHVRFLASDALAGRAVGTPEIEQAERYIADHFERIGLQPIPGEDDYFLEFELYEALYSHESTFVRFGGGGDAGGAAADRHGAVGHDFRPFWFSRDGDVSADLIFAGYGITAPEHDYDDYAGLDVDGKLVFVLRHEPNEDDPDSVFAGTEHSEHAYFTTKAETAARHGAAGMVLVTDPLHHEEQDRFHPMRRLSLDRDIEFRQGPMQADVPDGFVAVHVSGALGNEIARRMGGDLAEMQRAVDAGTRPAELGVAAVPARVAVDAREQPRRIAARNVAGYLPPTGAATGETGAADDPKLTLIGAHHDHLGSFEGTGDTVYNGADDNASGTAGVLELAEHFAVGSKAREHGMIFMTFTAEEWGLFGARAVVQQELLPLERIGRVVNLDMIGRNPAQDVRVYASPPLSSAVTGAVGKVGVSADLRSHSRRSASDHSVFLERGIDAVMFHTGLHRAYHSVEDEADAIAYEHMARVIRLVAATVRRFEPQSSP